MSRNWKTIGGVGPGVTGVTGLAAPQAVSGVFAEWIAATPRTRSGNPQVFVTVSLTVPSPIGTFTGVECFLDHPDSSGGLSIADGTQAADGTHPANNPNFAPTDIGYFPYKSGGTTMTFSFLFAAPKVDEYWRVYIVSESQYAKLQPIQFGLSGATPSYQILVTNAGGSQPTGAGSASGREFAPNVAQSSLSLTGALRGWTGNPNYEVKASGDQYWEFNAVWSWPVGDENYPSLGGVQVILDDGVGQTQYATVYTPASGTGRGRALSAATGSFRPHFVPVPAQPTIYRVWFVSFDTSGNQNTIVPGVTPSLAFTVQRQNGSAGSEYCANVTLATVPGTSSVGVDVELATGADGTAWLRIRTNWVPPTDLQWGNVEVDLLRPSTVGAPPAICKATLPPTETYIQCPVSVESWTFYIRSADVNNRSNTIVPGVTPSVVVSVGSTAGLLNLGKVNISTISSQFSVVGGVTTITNLNANLIITGNLQVGGGSGMPGLMKIFDHVGGFVGFAGDDTLGSGYVGIWGKQLRAGGSSPSTAQLQCDTAGNLTFSGALSAGISISAPVITGGSLNGATMTLNSNGIVTKVDNSSLAGGYAGLQVYNYSSGTHPAVVRPGMFRITDNTSSGNLRVDLYGEASDSYLDLYSSDSTPVKQAHLATGAGFGGSLSLYDSGGTQRIYMQANSSAAYVMVDGLPGIGNHDWI